MAEHDEIEKDIRTDQGPRWRRSVLGVFRFLSYAAAVTLTLMALVVVFVQTPIGRSIITTQVLRLVNDQINGTFTCDDVRIDVFHGIVIVHPRLQVVGTDLFTAEELRVTYDIASLVGHTTAINNVSIIAPTINLVKSNDGRWNYDALIKPSTDTTTKAPSKLVLRLRDLVLSSGSINIDDRTSPRGDGSTFDASHLALRKVDLRLGLLLDLGNRDYSVVLRSLSLRDQYSKRLAIDHLSAAVRLSPEAFTIRALVLEMPNTSLALRGEINDVDIERQGISSAVLTKHPFTGHIESERFQGEDLQYVLPFLDVIDTYSIKGDVEYTGDRVSVDDLDLHGGPVHVKGTVDVSGLEGKSPLYLDVMVQDSKAPYAEVQRRLRFINLPQLPFLGTTYVKHVHMHGRPSDSLMFDIDGKDQVGEIRGLMTLHLNTTPMAYSLHADVRRGDLTPFSASFAACNLNGRVDMVGRGFLLSELQGAYSISLDPSTISNRAVRSMQFVCRANGTGSVQIDTLEVDATPYSSDEHDVIMETRDRQTFSVSGQINASSDTLSYSLAARFSSLDLARLLENESLPTRISGATNVKAQGITIDEFVGRVDASLDEFSLEDRALLPFTFNVTSRLDDGTRTIAIVAPFARARIAGRYTPSNLISTFSNVATLLSTTAMRRSSPFTDSASKDIEYPVTVPAEVDATFDVRLFDASPFNVFLKNTTFSTQSSFRGKIESDPHLLRVTADEVAIADMFVRSDSLSVTADPCTASGVIEYAIIDSIPSVTKIDVQASCPNNIFIDKNVFHGIKLQLNGSDSSLYSSASGSVNGIYGLVGMRSRYRNGQVTLSIDTMAATVDAAKKLEWVSLNHAAVHARNQTFDVSGLALRRKDGEIITVDGVVSLDRFSNLRIRATDFYIPDVRRFVDFEEGHPISFLSGKMRELDISVNGTWETPVATLRLRADDVEYNKELIGSMNATMSYANRDIKGRLTISNARIPNAENALSIDVRHLPFDLGLRNVKKRIVQDGVIDIDMRATKLALAAVEPFLPAVERVQGIADGMVTVRGTLPNNLELGGAATFKNGTFLTSPTNIQYRADGSLHLEGSKLYLDTINVRNLDRDRRGGSALASGVVTFDGLSVSRVDFSVTSKGILIMNKGTQVRNPKVFGDVVVASGSKPILFYGPLDAPVLAGDVDVLYADIIFPQNRASSKAKYSGFVYQRSKDGQAPHRSVLDTSKVTRVTSDSPADQREQTVEAVTEVIKSTTASFSDILRFNLNIYLRGRTLMTMVFGLFEILIADLEPVDVTKPLTVTGRLVDNTTNISGKVRVKDGTSTYKFYKPFSASGTLDFTQGGLSNPTLDLKAVYNGRRMNTQINEPETYRVDIDITGTKQRPVARWTYYRNQRKQEGDSAKITGDALMMLLVGRTQDELTSSGQSNLVNEVNAAASAMATSALGDLLSGIGGLVQTVQMDLGADMSQTRLTVSGQLWSDVVYRLTGQVSDFAGNSTITVTIPFTVLKNADAMRYFMLDISRSVNNTGNITRFQRLWEIKLGARLP